MKKTKMLVNFTVIPLFFLLFFSSTAFAIGIAPGERTIVIGKDILEGEEKTYTGFIVNNEKEDISISLTSDSEFVKLSTDIIKLTPAENEKPFSYTVFMPKKIEPMTINITATRSTGNVHASVVSKVKLVMYGENYVAQEIAQDNPLNSVQEETVKVIGDIQPISSTNNTQPILSTENKNPSDIEFIIYLIPIAVFIIMVIVIIIYRKELL